jgi:hypothetical protein
MGGTHATRRDTHARHDGRTGYVSFEPCFERFEDLEFTSVLCRVWQADSGRFGSVYRRRRTPMNSDTAH